MSSAVSDAAPDSSSSASSSSSPAPPVPHIVIVPGNGCKPIVRCNWYKWLHDQLVEDGHKVDMRDMPDHLEAKRHIWLPFIRDQLHAGPHSICIGHSSGAEALMRLVEDTEIYGLILVSACHTDLGMKSERISNYYPAADGSNQWKWEEIKKRAKWIVQFHAVDDSFVPVAEGRFVAEKLSSQFIEQTKGGHYLQTTFPDLLETIRKKSVEYEAQQSNL